MRGGEKLEEEKIIAFFLRNPSLVGLEIQTGSTSLKLRKRVTGYPPKIVCSDWLGWFTPRVKKGERVAQDQILGEVLMAGVPNEIASPCQGEVLEIYALSGEPIEYGQVLFEIKPLAL